ncbi:uncharacterized protein F5Z01DRAFT_223983 [Emericellopsis atlantica]|uniref:Uncharacterized protein n=1 Tax=Emericellopsis atlantica TaxID=2614577 RepID=A0A9P8CMS0_9HYPO|nr:uncharacterized protein F5Z01DRAFT_223983 [Emericellopsis atlantica]KAG9252733.1 hypothetical protein F5Z01DRAFT_223983 [Emericellopsis atlantica]
MLCLSSTLLKGAALGFLLSLHPGVLSRSIPDLCPPSCYDVEASRAEHHRLQDFSLEHCALESRLDFKIHKDRSIEKAVCSGKKAKSVQRRSSEVHAQAEQFIDLQVIKQYDGIPIVRADFADLVNFIISYPGWLTGVDDTLPYWSSIEVVPGNLTLGFYIGRDIDPQSLFEATQQWGTMLPGGSSTFAAQRCGGSLTGRQTIGFVADGTGNVTKVQEITSLWNDGRCVQKFAKEEVWSDVSIVVRES